MFFFNLDDPMLKYIFNKTSNDADRPNNINNDQVKPRYRGHDSQTNRYEDEFSYI